MVFIRTGLIITALLLGWGMLRAAPGMVHSARATVAAASL